MIKEDYVSFETAKLLKEKGFEGYSIIHVYDEDAVNAYIKELEEKHLPYSSDDPKLKEFYYTIPTLQMTMKWLREVHNIFVFPFPQMNTNKFWTEIYQLSDNQEWENLYCKSIDLQDYSTYEDACEAAIKHCLTKII